jgi:hypothetical protein
MPTDLQQAASDYVAAGLHILALTGKKPNGRVHGDSWSYEQSWHGVAETQAELDALDRAFSPEQGTTGIAILIPKGILVADVDTEAAATLLKELGWKASEDSVLAQTKNGVHIWFVAPGADRNRWLGDRALLFKGFGGYVVAPPSLHFDADGNQDGEYRWLEDSALVDEGTLRWPDTIPPKALSQFTGGSEVSLTYDPNAVGAIREQAARWEYAPDPALKWWQWPRVGTFNTTGLEASIENAADGNQNNVIHWAAMTARDEGVPLEVAMKRLLSAAVRGGHPPNRARATINGAYKRAARG